MLSNGPSCHVVPGAMGQVPTYYSTIRIENYLLLGTFRETIRQNKTDVRSSSRRTCHKNVINNNSKVRTVARP